jgi:hypothetical protein
MLECARARYLQAPGGQVNTSTAVLALFQQSHDEARDFLPDLAIVAHLSMRKKREQEKAGKARTRHGVEFFVRVLVVGTILVVVIALAGDDELRASLASWVRSPDRSWR